VGVAPCLEINKATPQLRFIVRKSYTNLVLSDIPSDFHYSVPSAGHAFISADCQLVPPATGHEILQDSPTLLRRTFFYLCRQERRHETLHGVDIQGRPKGDRGCTEGLARVESLCVSQPKTASSINLRRCKGYFRKRMRKFEH
jgi:hypothetical protein